MAKGATAGVFWSGLFVAHYNWFHDMRILLALAAVVMIAVWGLLLFIQYRGRIVLRHVSSARLREPRRFQFSIKQLMVLTAMVAVVFGVRRSLGGTTQLEASFTVLAFCMFPVSLTAVWACLWTSRPFVSCLAVIVIAFLIGLIPVLYFDRYQQLPWVWSSVTVLQAAVCILSLLVVRALGYRLVRRSVIEHETELGGSGTEASTTSSSV